MPNRKGLALDYLYPILGRIPDDEDVRKNGLHYKNHAYWTNHITHWQIKLNKLYDWANTLKWLDKRAYRYWLNFYQGQLNLAKLEVDNLKPIPGFPIPPPV